MSRIRKNKSERFFVDLLANKLHPHAQYFSLPSSVCFNYCIKESINYCIKKNEVSRLKNYDVFDDFYSFLLKDTILKKIDEAEYYTLLNNVFQCKNHSFELSEMEQYLIRIKKIFKERYLNELYGELTYQLKSNYDDYDILEFNSTIFISELLNNGLSYQFLVYTVQEYIRKPDLFTDIYSFLDYIFYNNSENIEMYLPLKNHTSEELDFLSKKNQTISEISIEGNKIVCCKVYAKTIDFYNLCQINMLRIRSYMNIFKYYYESNIDFDYDRKVLIRREIVGDEFEMKLKDILSYQYYVSRNDDIIRYTFSSFEKLDYCNNPLFYKINNILSYAEKDNDVVNVGSYVDNWISLESLIKLSEFKSGYEGVIYYLPKILSISYFQRDLKTQLRFIKYSLEDFISDCCKDDRSRINSISKPFMKHSLTEKFELLRDYRLLYNELFVKCEDRIRTDVMRIYMLRNEYVHSSNLRADNNMQKIKLKRLLADTIDSFLKSLNAYTKYDFNHVSSNNIFTDIKSKYDSRLISLKILNNSLSLGKTKATAKELETTLSKEDILLNILLGRIKPLNTENKLD